MIVATTFPAPGADDKMLLIADSFFVRKHF